MQYNQSGDSVLAFLPIPGSVLQVKFAGPYLVEEKQSETVYVIRTPDRRLVCYMNLLKPYVVSNRLILNNITVLNRTISNGTLRMS